MESPRARDDPGGSRQALRSNAGIVSMIRLENFMCHSSLRIELDDQVNFITGQNGSGKSAILTALCIAFGCRAKGTQRAFTLKEFIITGCRENIASGKDGKEKLLELDEHFNIDVENPRVIMSQDKSREFLHSDNDKEKFKFFFKATLLQQVNDLLQNIRIQLDAANAAVEELECLIKPIMAELRELQVKIKNVEHVEEMLQQVQQLRKKLAWSLVYDVDRQIEEQSAKLTKLKD